MPTPGQERLPQIYIFWDSNNGNLKLPWAPPSADQFYGESSAASGFEARVVLENSSDPELLEAKVRDWNSRPNDLLVVGPSPAFLKKLEGLNLPSSNVSGTRIFIGNHQSLSAAKNLPGWSFWEIDEDPALDFLSAACTSEINGLKSGCRFSESAKKRPALAKLPIGQISVQFSDFKNPGNVTALAADTEMLSLAIAWDHLFRAAIKARTQATSLNKLPSAIKFSDGTIRLNLSRAAPEEVSKLIKLLTLQFLLKDGDSL